MRQLLLYAILVFFCHAESALAQIIPVPNRIESVSNGLWSDWATWTNGVLPSLVDTVVIATTVSVDVDKEFGYLTVLAGGTLSGVAGENKVLTVSTDVLNQGNIAQSGTGDDFRLFVAGDIRNEGTLNARRLWFTGAADQNLSQTSGAKWLSTVFNNKRGGRLVAGSTLDIGGDFTLINSQYRTLVMNNYDLIVSGEGTLNYATVESPGRLVGRTDETAFARNTTFTGPVTVTETVRVAAGVVFDSLVTVTGTLTRELSSNNYSIIVFRQDVVNQGTIEDEHPDRGKLRLRVLGDIRNEGIWTANVTEFNGSLDQTLYLSPGKMWAGGFDWEKAGGAVIALTDQVFGGSTRIDSLVMGEFDLAVSGTGQFTNLSNIYTSGTLQSVDGNEDFATGTKIVGNPAIQNRFSPGFQMTIVGDLLVTGTLESLRGGSQGVRTPLTIKGALTSHGSITNGANGAKLVLLVSGNITNTGSWSTEEVELIDDGSRTIWIPDIDVSYIYCSGDDVHFSGKNAAPKLTVRSNATCTVDENAVLTLDSNPSPSLNNSGEVVVVGSASQFGAFSAYMVNLTEVSEAARNLSVHHFGSANLGGFDSIIPGYWYVDAPSDTTKESVANLVFRYDDTTLSSKDEETLRVFGLDDTQTGWHNVSTLDNTTRNASSNTVEIENVRIPSAFTLTTRADGISGKSGISISIEGREKIYSDLGNGWVMTYSNHNSTATGPLVIGVMTDNGSKLSGHFMEIQEGQTLLAGPHDLFDSIYAPFGAQGSDAVFLADSMRPFETRQVNFSVDTNDGADSTRFFAAIAWKDSGEPSSLARDLFAEMGNYAFDSDVSNAVIGEIAANAYDDIRAGSIDPAPTTSVIPIHRVASLVLDRWPKPDSRGALDEEMSYTLSILNSSLVGGTSGVIGTINHTNANYSVEIEQIPERIFKTMVWPNRRGFSGPTGRQEYIVWYRNESFSTDTLRTVVIEDELDVAFDPTSVQVIRAIPDNFSYSVSGQTLRWESSDLAIPEGHLGGGFIRYSVAPKGIPSTGTLLTNTAIVTLNTRPPDTTNTVTTTLDLSAPVTTMNPLPGTLPAGMVSIGWSAADGAGESGVESATLYASINGGQFVPVGVTANSSMDVSVEPNRQYAFYAVSTDSVGNVESVLPASVSTQTVSGVGTEDEALPLEFALNPNYPNPFNPQTTIQFTLPVHGQTRLTVYDVTGRLVARLVDKMMPAGNQYVVWDARNVASGVYFYRLFQGNRQQTRPMVLLR